MFRCSECGTEFEIKPDFCDCGNDTFEEVAVQKEAKIETQPLQTSKEKTQNELRTVEKSESKKEKKSYYDYSYWDNVKKFFDPISTIIFLVCALLSLYIIFYAWNPTETEIAEKPTKQTQSARTNIPSIDKLWNDTPPVPVVKEEKPIVEEVKKIVEPIKKVEKKITTQIPKKQEVKKQEKPKASAVKTTTAATKPATTTLPKSTSVKSSAIPAAATTSTTTTVQKPVQKVVNKQELTNYKIQLRNRIASKIDFASVIGDGSCVVSFTVTGSGQLMNKKFQKQSDNFSLNDVVYNAVLKTTSFNPPPAAYNGETLKLTVKMSDGSFEVTLY